MRLRSDVQKFTHIFLEKYLCHEYISPEEKHQEIAKFKRQFRLIEGNDDSCTFL